MKFKNNIEVQAGLKDSSGSIGSSSQVLSSNGTNVTWVNLSFLGGSGTLNYVAKFTSGTTIGNSQIFDNGTNVGIGTTAPSKKLDVSGSISISKNAEYIYGKTSSGSNVRLLGINAGDVAYVGAIDSGPVSTIFNASSTSNTATFYTAGSERIRINSTGNVGIGTTTPGAKLEVNGTIKTTNDNLSFTGTSLYAGNADGTTFGYTPSDGISSITDLPTIESGWVSSFKYNGQTLERCTAGEDITKGQLVYLRSTGTWNLANARFASNSTPLLGIALDTVSATATFAVLLDGIIITAEHAQAGSITIGAPLYVETSTAGTAGDVTETPPANGGEVIRLIGHNISDITGGVIIRFQPDNIWLTV